MLRRMLAFSLIALLFCIPAPAFAGGGGLTGGATEITQLANNSELASLFGKSVEQVANQVKQITNQIKQYTELVKSTLGLPMGIWNDITGQFNQLKALATSLSDMWQSYGNLGDFVKEAVNTPTDLSKTSKQSAEAKRAKDKNSAVAAAKASDLAAEQNAQDAASLKTAYDHSASAQGQTQAIQAGNEINSIAAQSLMKLRNDVNRQTNMMLEEKTERLMAEQEFYDRMAEDQAKPIAESSFTTILDN